MDPPSALGHLRGATARDVTANRFELRRCREKSVTLATVGEAQKENEMRWTSVLTGMIAVVGLVATAAPAGAAVRRD